MIQLPPAEYEQSEEPCSLQRKAWIIAGCTTAAWILIIGALVVAVVR